MDIVTLPLLDDNYAYLLHQEGSPDCAVVDPSTGPEVAAAIAARGLRLRTILLTHHHPDHVGGVAHLAAPGVEVVAGEGDRERIAHLTTTVADGAAIRVLGAEVRCLGVPGHTRAAIAYHVAEVPALFTGDTLFLAGCGRLFEGTPAQMLASLHRLAALPQATQVYCGHEYTEKNLAFAKSLLPHDAAVADAVGQARRKRQGGLPTVPGQLADELRHNPFLRTAEPAVMEACRAATPLAAFTELRQRRDRY